MEDAKVKETNKNVKLSSISFQKNRNLLVLQSLCLFYINASNKSQRNIRDGEKIREYK